MRLRGWGAMFEEFEGLGLGIFGDIKGMEPINRLSAAVESLDNRSAEILTYHAAIERELDLAIAREMPHASRLRGLSFSHKISVWAALMSKSDEHVGMATKVLIRLNDLRNAVAHGDEGVSIDKAMKRLHEALPSSTPPTITVRHAAAFVLGFLHPLSPEDFAQLQAAIKVRNTLLLK